MSDKKRFMGTPGPWKVDTSYEWSSKVRSTVAGFSGQLVVDCIYRHEDPDATLANARLIAAAPDLLGALELILPLAEDYAAAHRVGPANEKCIQMAKEVVARALGGDND